MNRNTHAAFRVVWAAILGATSAVCTAEEITVDPGDDLAGAIQNAPDGSTIRLGAGVHTLSAPVTLVDKSISLEGDVITSGPLPTAYVIRFGSIAAGNNAVRNGDFELGSSDWTVTGADVNSVITQSGSPYEGNWHAWLKPDSGPLMPDDRQELRLATPIDYNTAIPPILRQKADLSTPAPGTPAQLLYELRQPLNLPPMPPLSVNRVRIPGVPITPMAPNLHLWIQTRQWNPGDEIAIFLDDESGTPVAILGDAELSVGIGDIRIYGFSLSTYLGVHDIIIRATTAAAGAPGDPSLYLLLAAETRNDLLPPQPMVPPLAPIDPMTFSTQLDPAIQSWFAAAGISVPPLSVSVSLGIPGITTVTPLGGIGTPRLNMRITVPQKNPDAMSVDSLEARVYDSYGTMLSMRYFPADDPLFSGNPTCVPVSLKLPAAAISGFSLACRISQPTNPVAPVDTEFVVDALELTPLHPALATFYAVNLLQNPSFELGPVDWNLETPEFGPTPPLNLDDLISTDPADQCDGARCVRFRYPNTFMPYLYAWIKVPQWNTGSGDYFQIQANGSPVFSINDSNSSMYATGDWVKITATLPLSDPINLTFEASTSTRTSTPSIIVVGAAEVSSVDPGTNPSNLLSLNTAVALPVPGLGVSLPPVNAVSAVLAYRGNEVLRFGGVGYPGISFRVSAPQHSGNGTDRLELLVNNASVWTVMESDSMLSTACGPVELAPVDPGGTLNLVFAANLLSTGNSATDTIFVVDDVCVTPVCALWSDLDPTIDPCAWSMVPSFDATESWTSYGPAGPLTTPIVRTTTSACSPDKAAVFTVLSTTERKAVITLQQTGINLPSGPSELTFHLTANGAASDRLLCSLNGQALTPVFSAADPGLASGREVSLSIPPSLQGVFNATLEFQAIIAPSLATDLGFKIDEVSISQAATGTLFILNGNALLTVRGVSFENGNPAVSLRDQSTLCMSRSLVRASSGPGVILNHSSNAEIACSVIDGGGGIRNDGTGRLVLFQTTFLGGAPGGPGPMDVIASILMNSVSGSNARVILSYVPGQRYPSPDETNFPNLDGTSFSAQFSGVGWPGKLENTLENLNLRNTQNAGDLPSWATVGCASYGLDFEGDFRSSSDGLMAGADELGGSTGGDLPRWVSCSVSPRVVGKDTPVTIRVETLNIDLANGALVLVPEEPVAGVPGSVDNQAHIVVIPLSNAMSDGASLTLTFNNPFQYRSALNTPVCTDGRIQIYLRDSNGALYGPGKNEDVVEPQARLNWSFLVDTLLPELVLLPGNGNGQAGSPRVVSSSDNVLAAGGPGGWPPLQFVMPASYGIIDTVGPQATPDTKAKDRHVFLNAPAGQPLQLTLEARFTDPRPRNNVGQVFNLLTVSGFGAQNIDLAENSPINTYLGSVAGSGTGRLSPVSTGTVVRYQLLPGSAAGESVTMIWTCQLDETEGLKLAAQPQAKDRAGNESKQPAFAMKIWWFQNARAEFSVGPQGVVIRKPRFEWRMARPFTFAADEIFPCFPIARYKLWKAVDAGLPAAQTRWEALGGWSPWTRTSIELDSAELYQLQNDPGLQGQMILISIIGGDEAGNLQLPGIADGATLNSLADLESAGVDYRWWINGDSRAQTSIETDAKVNLYWRNGTSKVRDFGAARRVPAPREKDAANGVVVDAMITLRALLPSRAANIDPTAATAQSVIHWTLFREGQPIKAESEPYTDTVTPDQYGKAEFQLSEAIQALFNATGLEIADPNRLFDTGQKREIRFVLTATAEALIPDGSGGMTSVKDSTPAVVEFAVYPPEIYEGIRDERPTRVYQRK